MNGIDSKSNITTDVREEASFIQRVALGLRLRFRVRDGDAGNTYTAEEVLVVPALSVIVDDHINGLP
ncbi:hypothetical protein CKAN_01416800 [Cinnamomum micranthum f. kanehirae]|uniref:Uncharacterized protein n=1 Tax=Cinnamomum micranthum f. kanehirae TaxID=337451 RepID=A0A443P3K5_9MAGN|nr:hypothetical protein CKAN_01416800 [Cinnamomum micranthum f. kanehirae]